MKKKNGAIHVGVVMEAVTNGVEDERHRLYKSERI